MKTEIDTQVKLAKEDRKSLPPNDLPFLVGSNENRSIGAVTLHQRGGTFARTFYISFSQNYPAVAALAIFRPGTPLQCL
jgi:hypothetical protein